jgi:transposase InsO family protein
MSSRGEEEDAELARLIREILVKHHYRYSSPQVKEALRRDYGKSVGVRKVVRLMQENGLNARRNLPINKPCHTGRIVRFYGED